MVAERGFSQTLRTLHGNMTHDLQLMKIHSLKTFLTRIFRLATLSSISSAWNASNILKEVWRNPGKDLPGTEISWCNFYNHNNIKHFHLTISTRWNTFFCIYF